ncbi:MAG: hypothetical protein KGN32_08410 [Burkholderiales bacterium]|nr:hypothetical protein [Burkholderiales bacterium]
MKMRSLITVLTLTLGAAAFAQAPAPVPKDPLATPRIDQREANQEKRIEQGVASGQLTPREANRLQRKEDRIAHAEQRAKADGVVTAQERKHLMKMENHASRDIHREKHDRQRDMNHDGMRDHKAGTNRP